MQDVMEKQTVYHFFASSILFIYEGYEVVAAARPHLTRVAPKAAGAAEGGRDDWAPGLQEAADGAGDSDEAVRMDVRMIDFAHVFEKSEPGGGGMGGGG
jgi:hypothetical protein